MDPRLSAAIASPAIRDRASALVQLARSALEDLTRLDETLYGRFVASRAMEQEPALVEAGLRLVWSGTFAALEALLVQARETTKGHAPEPAPAPDDPFENDDLDFSDFGPALEEEKFELGNLDIGNLVDGLDEATRDSENKRWTGALQRIGSIQYALDQQYREARERAEVAFGGGQFAGVLELLDDTASSATEAIHAIVAAVYEAFAPEVDQNTLVPQYLTTLSRALLVRRGIARLSAALGPHNAVLQGDDPTAFPAALDEVRRLVTAYVASESWRAMRASDRWELAQFEQRLREQPAAVARLTSEGLVKYLESLASINQREVLVRHDARVVDELRDALTNARELADLSPKTSHDILARALRTVPVLRGKNPMVDRILDDMPMASDEPATLMAWLDELLGVA